MSIIRITKEFRFEGAHALLGYDGKCRHIHGHSYRLIITVKGIPIDNNSHPKNGMVMDFGDLKQVVQKYITDPFDHAFLLKSGSPIQTEIAAAYQNVMIFDFQPTCENLTIYFANILNERLPSNIKLHSIKLYETPSSYAEWNVNDNSN